MTIFRDYFTEKIKDFNIYHTNLLFQTTENDIHRLRTSIKKLRTFNTLLDGLLFRYKDFPKGFIEVFKLTGEIRDIQIQQNVLKDIDSKYKSYLIYSCQDKISKFKIKDNFDLEIQYLEDKLSMVENYHIDEQIISNIKTHVKIIYNEILDMVKNISPDNLHDIRKKIKRVYYIKLMLGDKVDIKKFYDIQETIGLWHDCDVTIENIKNLNLREIDDNDYKTIEILSKKRDVLYDDSIKLLSSIII